jgi:hypothetical protein
MKFFSREKMSSLSNVQEMLTRYGMSSYVVLGNIGNLITISVFIQSNQRLNPCSIYLLFMSICNLICLDVGIIPIIYSLDHSDVTSESLIACRIQFYIRHTFFQMMRTYKVLACIDRYALCSSNIRIRLFSQHRIAINLILICGLFWFIICIFFSIIRTIQNGSCNIFNEVYLMIYTIYYLIFAGIVPPMLIIIFTILVIKNLTKVRNRVQPFVTRNSITGNEIVLRKRDRDLIKMVFIEVIFYVISTMPFSIYLIYKIMTDYSIKSVERQQIESFLNYLTQSFLMYLNTALPFYIYILTSTSFRKNTKFIFIRIYTFIKGNEDNRHTQ